jgi:hypothetical protein
LGVGGKSTSAESGGAPNGDPDAYGRGAYDEETGLSEWYDYPEGHTENGGLTWAKILTHWNLIEADLQDAGIDTGSGILAVRSWRWLAVRITALLAKPPGTITEDGRAIPSTRLGMALHPPGPPRKR